MRIRICIVFLLITGMYGWAENKSGQAGWKAGVAKIAITPKESMWMAGYASRTKPSEGKIHELWAKALFLEDANGNKSLLITTDMLGFPKSVSDHIRNDIQNKMGLMKSQVILSSSHSHSGPVLGEMLSDVYELDALQKLRVEQYTGWLSGKIVELAVQAQRSSGPVKIYSQNGVVRFQVNRRNNKEAKLTGLTELKGPNDFAVPVMKIVDKKDKIKAIVFGYACHATVLSGYSWSGDYPGFAQIELEKKYKGATAMFFQGCGADQNPMPRRTVALAQQFGQELAASVERSLNENMNELSPKLATAYNEIDLKLNTPPTKAELGKMETELAGFEKRWAKSMLAKINNGENLIKSYPYPVQVWRLGEQLIVVLGGETTIEYAIKCKELLGTDIFVLGYSNDVMGYIPSEKILKEGGYEGQTSHKVYGLPSVWESPIEGVILNEIVKLAKQVGGTPLKEGVQ